jgi:hypothetical protein
VSTESQASETVQQTTEAPQALLSRIDGCWQELWSVVSVLGNEELLRPGLSGVWSGKDVLAHIARWRADRNRSPLASS